MTDSFQPKQPPKLDNYFLIRFQNALSPNEIREAAALIRDAVKAHYPIKTLCFKHPEHPEPEPFYEFQKEGCTMSSSERMDEIMEHQTLTAIPATRSPTTLREKAQDLLEDLLRHASWDKSQTGEKDSNLRPPS